MTACLAGCDESAGTPRGLLLAFGETGMGPLEFSYPRAAALDAVGRLYIVDKTARIQCLSTDEILRAKGPDSPDIRAGRRRAPILHVWRTPEHEAGKPTGLGVAPDGRVYVADTHYSRVLVYQPDGTLDAQFGTRGTGPGQFLLPTDVAVADDGRVYVGEYGGNDRISVFRSGLRAGETSTRPADATHHEFLFSFGRPGPDAGAFQRPQSLRFGPDGTLWVADACNHRICRYAPEGTMLSTFGTPGTAAGQLRFPYGLAFLSDGTLVVAEFGGNRLQRFTPDGRSLGIWGAAGRSPGALAYPWAVEVDAEDRMYVLDSGNNRVQVVDARAAHVWE